MSFSFWATTSPISENSMPKDQSINQQHGNSKMYQVRQNEWKFQFLFIRSIILALENDRYRAFLCNYMDFLASQPECSSFLDQKINYPLIWFHLFPRRKVQLNFSWTCISYNVQTMHKKNIKTSDLNIVKLTRFQILTQWITTFLFWWLYFVYSE